MTTKTCTGCGHTKPLSEFWRKTRNPDGYQTQCKTCTGQDQKTQRERARTAPAAVTPASEDDWRHHAACRGENPEIFFPVGKNPAARAATATALTVCARCPLPIRRACLEDALAMETPTHIHGIRGGLTDRQRRTEIRRRRGKAKTQPQQTTDTRKDTAA